MDRLRPSAPQASLLAAALVSTVLAAHPSVSLVRDGRGNVFYSDLKQVWRIAPDGSRSVAVAGVHTHELWVEPDGALVGEHLWYEGEATKRWGHRVWRLGPDGSLRDVLPARPGFLPDDGYSFVRDGTGTHYWADSRAPVQLRKRLPDGSVVLHSRGPFTDVRWMTATAEGVVFLVDARDLKRVEPDGTVRTLVAGLQARRAANLWRYDRHALMGLWTDGAGNVYVADAAGRAVRKVDRGGRVTVAAPSPLPWRPTGGLVAPDGALWVLEYGPVNGVRVRRIGPDGKERVWP